MSRTISNICLEKTPRQSGELHHPFGRAIRLDLGLIITPISSFSGFAVSRETAAGPPNSEDQERSPVSSRRISMAAPAAAVERKGLVFDIRPTAGDRC
jgi:hypothetical protein